MAKKAIKKTPARRTSTNKKSSKNNWPPNFFTRNWKALAVVLIIALVGTYLVVRSYANNQIGIHIAPRAINLNSNADGPKVVADSTAAKKNVQSVYVASSGTPNQVSVTQALKKGSWEVCTLGRPTVNNAAGKLRVSDKPYGTESSLTAEATFKSTPTNEYIKLACPVITLSADTTVYISHIVTAGSYNFSIDAATPTSAPSTVSAVPCELKPSAESCWAEHTGVKKGTGYTAAQIVAGQSTLTKVTSQSNAPAGTTFSNGNLTVNKEGTVVDRIWLEGCIAVKAKNVTIKNSLIRTSAACHGGNGGAMGGAINTDGVGTTGLLIQDTEVDARNVAYDYTGIGAAEYTCIRCNVHGAVKNFWAGTNVVIKESYTHDLSTRNGDIHSAVIDADSGSNITIDHSFIKAGSTGYVTAAVQFLSSWGPGQGLTLNNSYLEGGTGADLAMSAQNYNVKVTNNAFSRNNGWGGTTFVYGFNKNNKGMVWTGNYIPETGAALPTP